MYNITGFIHYCDKCKADTKHEHNSMGEYLVKNLPRVIFGECEQCGSKVRVLLQVKVRALTEDEKRE